MKRRKGYSVWAHEPSLSEEEVSAFFETVNRYRERALAREVIKRDIESVKAKVIAKRDHTTDRAAALNKVFGHECA